MIASSGNFSLNADFYMRLPWLPPEKGGNIVRLYRMDRRPDEIIVDGRQIGLPGKDDVGSILARIDAPVVLHAEAPENRAVCPRKLVQLRVNPLRVQFVGDLLRPAPVSDPGESVVHQFKIEVALS